MGEKKRAQGAALSLLTPLLLLATSMFHTVSPLQRQPSGDRKSSLFRPFFLQSSFPNFYPLCFHPTIFCVQSFLRTQALLGFLQSPPWRHEQLCKATQASLRGTTLNYPLPAAHPPCESVSPPPLTFASASRWGLPA